MLRLANVQSGRAWVFSPSKEDSTPQGLVFFLSALSRPGGGFYTQGTRGKGGGGKGEKGVLPSTPT